MDSILEFVAPELLVLVPVLFFVGIGLKWNQKVPDKWIPSLLGGLGIFMALLWIVATREMNGYQDILMAIFSGITQGILCAGCSVYVDQLIKQSGEEQ